MMHDETLNFSFSGLKTAVMREINKLKTLQQFNNTTIQQPFEVQEAITDVLVKNSPCGETIRGKINIIIRRRRCKYSLTR